MIFNLFITFMSVALFGVNPKPTHLNLAPWCPYFPEYRFLADGRVIDGSSDLDRGFSVVIPSDLEVAKRQLQRDSQLSQVEDHQDGAMFADTRGFHIWLERAKEFWKGAHLASGQYSDLNGTIAWITRDVVKNEYGTNWNTGLSGQIHLGDSSFTVKGDQLIFTIYAIETSRDNAPRTVIRHAYLEERDRWSGRVLSRHDAKAIPSPSKPIDATGMAPFSLTFPYQPSKEPVRHYIVCWFTCSDGENQLGLKDVQELNFWGPVCKVGQRVELHNGHLVLVAK